jgi:HD-GYP domain-containing protein (c-di-GMP phosphodiesterase class II)
LAIANKELAFQNKEKEKRAAELAIANKELVSQNDEKEKRAAELAIANKELAFQNKEKEKRAAELAIANKELVSQNDEKEKRTAELAIANQELAFQNKEKEKRASELAIANTELAFQNDEKEKRASELGIANQELAFQNKEKEKRASELAIANKELAFQNEEKEKRASELAIANKELAFQNEEKEERASELAIANKELAFQNIEKEKRASELAIANKELAFQNIEKEKRASELAIANQELAFQNKEKEKRAAELAIANENIARQLQNIHALHKIDRAILGSQDLNLTLHVVLEQAKIELHVDAAAILLLSPYSQILEFAAGIGFQSKTIERSQLRLGEGLNGHAALAEGTMSVTHPAENNEQFVRTSLMADEGFVTYFSAPIIFKGQVRGILEVFHRSLFTPDQDWLNFLEVLAGQTAIAIDSATILAKLQRANRDLFNAYDSTIEGWSRALDLRDKETEGHSQRVTTMTMKLADMAGVSETELGHIRRGALLHDIGKMGVPDCILLKPDKLTDEEWVVMRKHPVFSFEILSPIAYLRPALDIPYCHHEKWDGSGYPRGLKGEQIPQAARLFAIVDVWDALRSDRPYRQGWPAEKVIEHIKSLSGTHFEPNTVGLFIKMLSEHEMNPGRQLHLPDGENAGGVDAARS